MTGRGIDQVLPHPSDPVIYEVRDGSALTYVGIAEERHGDIARPVSFEYIWGDFLQQLNVRSPHARLINLETAITASSTPVLKGINYRMHPANVPCLAAAGIGCCALANNHVMDWGVAGLLETLDTLKGAGIASAGAGRTATEAARPAILEIGRAQRLLVFSLASPTSGTPLSWQATEMRPGLWVVGNLSMASATRVVDEIRGHRSSRRPGCGVDPLGRELGVCDIRRTACVCAFSDRLRERGVVHGHSSHHARGIEVHRDRLILYGCGDFVNDYEGIGGHEEFRPDLVLGYFVGIDARGGRLLWLEMVPFQSRRFRLQRASRADAG